MSDYYGRAWVYESLVGALPGVDLPPWLAVVVQFVLFEGAVLAVGAVYDLWQAVPAATVAVTVATVGSAFMLDLGARVRRADPPDDYAALLFGSQIEVVLGVFAFAALVTYLFVYDPRAGTPLLETLLGPDPPLPAVYLLLLVCWDVCYRIGTGWWAAVAGFWRSLQGGLDPETARALAVADVETVGFGMVQLVLVPVVWPHPVLAYAVLGHVVAVAVVAGLAAASLRALSRT